jgi:ribosomal-protein-alanine N-acetyltransferase
VYQTGYAKVQNHSLNIKTETTEAVDALRITELLASDIPAVAAIERHSNLEPWTGESFLEELLRPHSCLQVARVRVGYGEVVAGYICFWLVADEIQILNIAVEEAFRRQGIGRALLLHCLGFGFGKKVRKAVLEVRSSNLAAQHLYRSLGFKAVGQRPDYYGGLKEPAVLMELSMEKRGTVQ